MKINKDIIQLIERSLAYIDAHIQDNLTLDSIAGVSGYSPYHFHRLFKAVVGESPMSYVRRVRLDNSAYDLKIEQLKIIDLALASGFSNPESYARAFFKRFHMNPSVFQSKNGPGVPLSFLDGLDAHLGAINIVTRPSKTYIFASMYGAYKNLHTHQDMLEPWRALLKHFPETLAAWSRREILGLCHDDPDITQGDQIRYDHCIDVPEGFTPPPNIPTQIIHGGRYLKALHLGPAIDLGMSYDAILWHKAPEMGLTLRNLPPFEVYTFKGDALDSIEVFVPIV